MIFLLQKQFFEKITTEGGLKLIVLNPFLDSLCNYAFKNIGLAPGIPKTCFQHPQDIVYQIMEIPRCDYNISIQHMYRTLEYIPRCKDRKVI